LSAAGLEIDAISAAGFGDAGYDWPSERADTLNAIGVLGLTCPLDAVNDMVIGLIAGASQGWGVVIDAGTGTNCRGRGPDGRDGMVTGCSSRFGEHGGAGDLVRRAVWAVTYEWCQRGPATQLTPALIAHTGARDLTDLVEGLTQGHYFLDHSAARLVVDVARAGDPVAVEALAWLGGELAAQVNCVTRQIDAAALAFEVVMIGSLFKSGPLLVEPMKAAVLAHSPRASFVPLAAPPAVGGVLLGMQAAGVDFRPIRERLIAETFTVYHQS
jgi:N-acetylglucosamine kinase-like BadF-type ATPase